MYNHTHILIYTEKSNSLTIKLHFYSVNLLRLVTRYQIFGVEGILCVVQACSIVITIYRCLFKSHSKGGVLTCIGLTSWKHSHESICERLNYLPDESPAFPRAIFAGLRRWSTSLKRWQSLYIYIYIYIYAQAYILIYMRMQVSVCFFIQIHIYL